MNIIMETTDQNMVDNSGDLGPLLMHDPEDEVEGEHSLTSPDQHTLLSDVHLPDGSNFMPHEVDKDHQLEGIDHSLNVDKGDHQQHQTQGVDPGNMGEPSTVFKFEDGQPVQLEDGSTAYILTSFKKGTQPIILEDGTTAYISHEPPTPHKFSLDQDSLNILDELPSVAEAEESRMMEQAEMATGADHKLFKCEFEGCKKVYTTYHHLQYHRRSHLDKKPFVCGFSGCEKTFATSYGLKSHIRVHTGEKPYKCTLVPDCKKAFKTSGDLQKHIRTHTGEKPFRCPFEGCNRSFTTSNIRKVHIRTHTGERPYSCEDCGKKFASATNHKNHIRIHTGEKPYVCTYEGCSKRFTEYSSLYKHQVVHSVDKPYACTTCGKLYRQASTLAMHRRTAHGENDVVLTDADMIGGQLIAQEFYSVHGPGKDRMLATELPAGTQIVTTQNHHLLSPHGTAISSASGKQTTDQHVTHINPRNVVVLTNNFAHHQRGVNVGGEQALNAAQILHSIDDPLTHHQVEGDTNSQPHEKIHHSVQLS